MSDRKGTFIAVEEPGGISGSSYFEAVVNRLKDDGYKVVSLSFPKHDEESSHFLREYQKGRYRGKEQLESYSAGLFYALDRFASAEDIEAALEENLVVVVQNWSGTTMAMHADKLPAQEIRKGYFLWLDNLEYHMFDMPRPDKSYIIKSSSYEEKSNNSDKDQIIDEICRLFPKDFVCIDGARSGKELDKNQVAEMIIKSVKPMLPKKSEQGDELSAMSQKLVVLNDNEYKITHKGRERLSGLQHKSSENLKFIKQSPDSVELASIFARFSRTEEPLDVSMLYTIENTRGKEKAIAKQIDEYNDSSIHQMHGHYVVFADISQYLARQIMSHRMGSFIEKPQQFQTLNEPAGHDDKPYYIPKSLDRLTEVKYRAVMDNIYQTRQEIKSKLQKAKGDEDAIQEALGYLLPDAHKQTLIAHVNGQAIQSIIIGLAVTKRREAINTAKALAKHIYSQHPAIFHRLIDSPDVIRKITNSKKLKETLEITAEEFNHQVKGRTKTARLISSSTKNELDLLPHILYEIVGTSFEKLDEKVSSWPITKKMDVMEQYLKSALTDADNYGRALEIPRYTWEITCSKRAFKTLQKHKIIDAPATQRVKAESGYVVPKIIKKFDLEEQYDKCYKLSSRLYTTLKDEGYEKEAEYTLLGGHKTRFKFSVNYRELAHIFKTHKNSKEQELKKIAKMLHEGLLETSPMLADALNSISDS